MAAFTAFPTLLTAQQYGVDSNGSGKMKKPITKNSWKWKWDCVKKYKYVNEGGKIVKKVKQPMAGLRDLSKLDMWTQLAMRNKREVLTRQEFEASSEANELSAGEAARDEKRKLISQLDHILDRRVLPQINLEQNDQSIIKIEKTEEESNAEVSHGSLAVATTSTAARNDQIPEALNLLKRNQPLDNRSNLILSGEWARPRCYICFGCGSKFPTIRSLEEHKVTKHPYVHSTHYEIVGKALIDGNLLENFYIPSMALQRQIECNKKANPHYFNSICAEDSMDSMTSYSNSLTKSDSIDMDSNSLNSKMSMSSTASSSSIAVYEENTKKFSVVKSRCSKCQRDCNGMLDLYRHMLDCSGDYAWLLAKKRNSIKYRYFGSKRRRAHRANNGHAKVIRPKTKSEPNENATPKVKGPPTPRPRPSDGKCFPRQLIFAKQFRLPELFESIRTSIPLRLNLSKYSKLMRQPNRPLVDWNRSSIIGCHLAFSAKL